MAIGQSKQRLDAEAKVTGRARYTDDMGLLGMRHAAYVHSTIAHGMVLSNPLVAEVAGHYGDSSFFPVFGGKL